MKPTTEREYKRRITKVLVHIQQNLAQPLALDDLARVAAFSPYHFHRVFRGMVGESVKEHIRRLRLEAAAQRLKGGGDSVTQIAFEAGYEALESFTRAFQSRFGKSPSAFRRAKARPSSVRSESESESGPAEQDSAERLPHASSGLEAQKPPLEVEVVRLSPRKVAFLRHTGPYDQVGATWSKLMGFAMSHGLFGPDFTMLGLCHDDPDITDPQRLRYDACIVISEAIVPPNDLGVQVIPGGPYAQTTHLGPYDHLGDTYARLCGEWLPPSGFEPDARPGFEIYRNSPMNTAPEQLETLIHLPLRSLSL